jgi:hypothetical protein
MVEINREPAMTEVSEQELYGIEGGSPCDWVDKIRKWWKDLWS